MSYGGNLLNTDYYTIRPYRETDRPIAAALGVPVIDWYNRLPEAALHLCAEVTATGEVVAHLQATDRSVPKPTRRQGEIDMRLAVASAHRQRGIGSALLEKLIAFSQARRATLLYYSYNEGDAGEYFCKHHGFVERERFLPSHLDLSNFQPTDFAEAMAKVAAQDFRLFIYNDIGDTMENRRKLYELEQVTRADIPFRAVSPFYCRTLRGVGKRLYEMG